MGADSLIYRRDERISLALAPKQPPYAATWAEKPDSEAGWHVVSGRSGRKRPVLLLPGTRRFPLLPPGGDACGR